jgi:hypothetical protein
VKRKSMASPPNLRRLAPYAYASGSKAPKVLAMTSETSSAPTRPWRASRSDILVNPEMSMKTIDPSTER